MSGSRRTAARGLLVALPLVAACSGKGGDSGVGDGGVGDGGDTGLPAPTSCAAGAAAVDGDQGFWTVDDAVAAAADGDTVTVCAGTHAVALLVSGTLSLEGGTGTAADVRLTPLGEDPVINVAAGADLTVSDLAIADVPSGDTAAVRVDEASLTLVRVVVEDNAGGGVRAQAATGANATVTVEDCTLTGNQTSAPGGAIATTGGGRVDLSISGSSLWGNQADIGGAVYAGSGSGTVTIATSELTDNVAASLGGGFGSLVDDGVITVTDATLSGNQARDGGGLFISERAERTELTMSDTMVSDNIASQQGGGLYLGASDSVFSLSGLLVEGNTAGDGGGLHLMGEDGTTATLTVQDSTLRGNQASRSGGAVQVLAEGLTGSVQLAGGGIDGNQATDAAFVLDLGVSLDSAGVDWGEGKLDNMPADLATATVTWDDLGAGESVACDAAGTCSR